MYQLTLSDEQVQMLLRALDLYSRIGCGQFEEIPQLFAHDPRRPEARTGPSDAFIYLFKRQLLPLEGNASYSICSSDVPVDYRLAWDCYQVVRHHLAWEGQPEGDIYVQFDQPMNVSGIPFCTIETVTLEEKNSI